MAHTAYVCRIRTDIPAGALQWTDVRPNTSQRSLVYDSAGQSGYLGSRATNSTLAALVANATVAEYTGVAAYLIDHVIDEVSGVTITVTVANAAALAFIAQMDSGLSIDINAAMVTSGGAGAGTTLTNAAGSNGSLKELLKILSGAEYTLPSGSTVGGLGAGAALGSFTNDSEYRQMYSSGSLQMSCGEGQLASFALSTFEYDGTANPALVVYDYQGTALTSQ